MRAVYSKLLLFLFLAIWLGACSKEDEKDLLDTSPIVMVIYPIDGLGDRSYADNIYKGVEKAVQEHGLRVLHLVPKSNDEFKVFLTFLKEQDNDEKARTLFIVAESTITDMMDEFLKNLPDNELYDYLILENRNTYPNIHTLWMPIYGVTYEAGVLARQLKTEAPGIVMANDKSEMLNDGAKGFMAGFGDDEVVNTYTIIPKNGGYNLANYVYRLCDSINTYCDIVLPLCGGSAQGLYRYNRDYPNKSFKTIGFDNDMSLYSPLLPFSCVKYIDRAMEDCIRMWLDRQLPQHLSLGLDEGYTEIVLAPGYEESLQKTLNETHQTAINKEKEYEKK